MQPLVRSTLCLALALAAMLIAGTARGAPCDRLRGAEQKATVDALLRTQHAYDCCDETIAQCLKKPRVCKLARRLRDDICRRVEKGETPEAVERALRRRAESMLPGGRPASIDLAQAAMAGDPAAKTTVVVYACASCPFCAKVIPEVYRAVTTGSSKGKAKLYFRLFPIRGHQDSTASNIAFQAAHRLGAFWPYVLHAFANFGPYSAARQTASAKAAGLDPAAFASMTNDPAVRDAVVASKKEGILNRVEGTPAFFVNGRRITADPDGETILDLLDEETDRVAGAAYCAGK